MPNRSSIEHRPRRGLRKPVVEDKHHYFVASPERPDGPCMRCGCAWDARIHLKPVGSR